MTAVFRALNRVGLRKQTELEADLSNAFYPFLRLVV